MNFESLIDWGYIAASILFIVGLKQMNAPETARRGNAISGVGMLIAVVATLLSRGLSFEWIALGVVIGSAVGAFAAYRVRMTAMPEMVALFNGLGGLASLLVGWVEYDRNPASPFATIVAIYLTVLIGAVTFTGSVVAYARLAETVLSGKPFLFRGQQFANGLVVAALVLLGVVVCVDPANAYPYLLAAIALSLVLGVMSVVPIGGADMPVVISLLNSYSGLAAAAAGFVILNKVLIVSGSLVGASGIILTSIMCKAMNRSLGHVLFSGFGAASPAASGAGHGGVASAVTADEAYYVFEAARSVVFVPGYGMAVAQAQHTVKELGQLLEANGCEVQFAVHPVAGRMPGHMNVLLAEADVPYEQLVEMDDINPAMPAVDLAVVIGANDVVNPAARDDASSPIYGMPIINVDYARTVYVLKRSMAAGFAGLENPLFFKPNVRMLFGDAKASIQAIVAQFKG